MDVLAKVGARLVVAGNDGPCGTGPEVLTTRAELLISLGTPEKMCHLFAGRDMAGVVRVFLLLTFIFPFGFGFVVLFFWFFVG